MPLPGHPIPYALTLQERAAFIQRHKNDSILSDYLVNHSPTWGILITEDYGQFSVWFDASGILHVTDITNLHIARQIEKAAYISPNSSVIENILHTLQSLTQRSESSLETAIRIVPWLVLSYIAFQLFKK